MFAIKLYFAAVSWIYAEKFFIFSLIYCKMFIISTFSLQCVEWKNSRTTNKKFIVVWKDGKNL